MTQHPSKAIVSTLPNGTRVATEAMPGLETVAIAVSVGVGARYEAREENGVAHLLEHMAFKGTKRRNARAIAEEFDMIGGQSNAFTSMETTVYHAKVLKDDVALALDIIADILQNSVFDAEELARERGVVLQEIAMHHDTPDDLIFDYFDEVAFPDQPIGRSILGPEEQVAHYTREHLLGYMQRHYQPQRMVVSAAGAIDHDAFAKLAEAQMQFRETASPQKPEPAVYKGGDIRREKELEQLHLVLGLPGVSIFDDDFFTAQVYANILGGGISSRLFQEVREKRGLAYSIYASANSYSDCGMLTIYTASGTEDKTGLVMLLCDELRKMQDAIPEAELKRAKNQMKAEALMARENSASVCNSLGRHLLHYGRVLPLAEIIERIEKVGGKQVSAYAGRVVSTHAPSFAALGNISGLPEYHAIASRLRA